MSSIVAKRALAAAGYYPAFKRARTVGTIARMAYSNRRTLYRAATKIGRAWKRRSRRKAAFNPPQFTTGTASSKRTVIDRSTGPVNYSDVTQNLLVNLSDISHTTSNSIDGRQRNIVNVRGWKICMEIVNTSSAPLYVNVAIVVPKQSVGVSTSGFFRDSTSSRAIDFDATQLTGMEFHCLPINTDKYYVLHHRRYRLASSDSATNVYKEGNSKNFLNLDFYKKFNRQIRYEDNSDITAEAGRPYLLHWASNWGTGTGEVAVTSYSSSHRIIAYFREPK